MMCGDRGGVQNGGRGSNTFEHASVKEDYDNDNNQQRDNVSASADSGSSLSSGTTDTETSRRGTRQSFSNGVEVQDNSFQSDFSYKDDTFNLADSKKELEDIKSFMDSNGVQQANNSMNTFSKDERDALNNGLSQDEKTDLSRQFASNRSNGLLGSVSNFAGLGGSVVNGGIDAKQAYDFSKNTFGTTPSFGESLATGVLSAGKSALTSLVSGKVGSIAGGLVGKTVNPYAGAIAGIAASKLTKDSINQLGSNSEGTSTNISSQGSSDNGSKMTSNITETAASTPVIAATDYNSTFGNYDNHLKNFAYNSKTALDAWKV